LVRASFMAPQIVKIPARLAVAGIFAMNIKAEAPI
jgi:hypothetical protein